MNNLERTKYLRDLREKIRQVYDEEELQLLVFDLSLDWGDLKGETKSLKVQSLLIKIAQQGRLGDLEYLLKEQRTNVQWPAIPDAEQQQEDLQRIMPGNVHQTALEDYQEKIRVLLGEENLRQAEPGSPVRVKAQTYTNSVLPRLDKDRRLNVVRFLMQEKLIGESNVLHLHNIDLSGMNLRGFDFHGVDLSRANFSGSYLDSASFVEAKLDLSNLRRSSFNNANLSGASLIGAILEDASFIEAILDKTDLTEAHLGNSKFVNAHMRESKLDKIHIGKGIDFQYAILEEAKLSLDLSLFEQFMGGINFGYANLSRTTIRGKTPHRSNLTGVNFTGADLAGVDMRGVQLEGANFQGAILEDSDLTYSILTRTNFSAANLTDADLRDAEFGGTNFEGAILKRTKMSRDLVEKINQELSNVNCITALGIEMSEVDIVDWEPRAPGGDPRF